jgi:DNA-directed RNA polymerase specialized sigma24 family protein
MHIHPTFFFFYLCDSMNSNKNRKLVDEIKNGSDDVLVYLAANYFKAAQKVIRSRGFRDSASPEIFTDVLIKVWLAVRQPEVPSNIEFDTFFFNSLNDYLAEQKKKKKNKLIDPAELMKKQQAEIVARCVLIMDEDLIRLLTARYAEQLSFEKIAQRFNYNNAVIAQHELNKAVHQLEGIVKLRMNNSLN